MILPKLLANNKNYANFIHELRELYTNYAN
jgi:hypothetical protein